MKITIYLSNMKKAAYILLTLCLIAYFWIEVWSAACELWIKAAFSITGSACLIGLFILGWAIFFEEMEEK